MFTEKCPKCKCYTFDTTAGRCQLCEYRRVDNLTTKKAERKTVGWLIVALAVISLGALIEGIVIATHRNDSEIPAPLSPAVAHDSETPPAKCAASFNVQCERINSGKEPIAKIIGTTDISKIRMRMETCIQCGHYPNIEEKLPGARKLEEIVNKVRTGANPSQSSIPMDDSALIPLCNRIRSEAGPLAGSGGPLEGKNVEEMKVILQRCVELKQQGLLEP